METATDGINNKVDALLTVLDNDIQHIHDSLYQLNELRGLVIKRDDVALARLLGTIRARADTYAKNESKRQSVRKDLANALGWTVEQTTLSRLETALPAGTKAQVASKKAELQSLINKLKKEHLSTAMLLSECARFNSLLLRGVFGLGRTGTLTYRANGAAKRQTDASFVNLHL